MTVTFCGHSEVYQEDDVRIWLKKVVVDTIQQGADMFLLGGYGAFDRMAAGVVWEAKKVYSSIQSILVLPYLDRKIDTSGYDGTTYVRVKTEKPAVQYRQQAFPLGLERREVEKRYLRSERLRLTASATFHFIE